MRTDSDKRASDTPPIRQPTFSSDDRRTGARWHWPRLHIVRNRICYVDLLARFLWIFTTLGLIVVVVVIGFLIGIVRALESIDDGLSTASNSVTGVTGNVEALPDYIRGINSALSDIDAALKPIPGQVADINDSLQSVRDSAGGTDSSLKDTSRSLIDTSRPLENTSTTLGPPSP
jgi:uncharacterized protein YoxC